MMPYINSVTAVGRVGQNPEIKFFESGKLKVKISLAVRPPYKSDQPLWFDCEAWGKTAEIIADYVKQGSVIAIQGEMTFDRWIGQDGSRRSKMIIKIENVELLSRAESSNNTNTSKYDIANAHY
jgi:single-strand DNA-binding protein